MFRVKSSEVDRAPASVAVTRTCSVPLKSRGGIPEKVRLAASKVSQAGSGSPFTRTAASVSVASSTSLKVPTGNVKLTAASSGDAWSEIGAATTGASLTGVMVIVAVAGVASCAPELSIDA